MGRTIMVLLTVLAGWAVLAQSTPPPPPPTHPELRQELLDRTAADQAAREAFIAFLKEHGQGGTVVAARLKPALREQWREIVKTMTRTDRENTEWLIGVVDRLGWPTYAMVGQDGGDAAWLLVQHADADPKFQRRALDLMTALPKGQVSLPNVAYLTDRVLLAEGKKQRYGTQFAFVAGKLSPRPLEDPENVDARRRAMGLPPLAEYVKTLERAYGIGP